MVFLFLYFLALFLIQVLAIVGSLSLLYKIERRPHYEDNKFRVF